MMRGGKVALIISIVLNMLLAGMLLGDVSRQFVSPATFDARSELAKLPSDKRALFESIMGPAKKQMDMDRTQIDSAKKEALRILTSDSFDASAYMTQVQHMSDMHKQMKKHIAEAVAQLAKQLTTEQRVLVAAIISHPPFTLPPGALTQLNSASGSQQ